MRGHTWRVAALLSLSGGCALVYQIGWLREFRLIFGASTAASAAVLAIFIGGLGLGGLLLGARADRHPRPILFYAQLEAIVAVSAAASPLLLALVRHLYILAGGTPRLGLLVGTISRLALSALVLAVPTTVMGGTLPAAARGVTRAIDARRRDVAALYGLNTLGAVAGCVIATFYLLELFGTRATLWLAAAVNLLVAILARQLGRTVPALDDAPVTSAAGPAARVEDRQVPLAFLLVASGLVGFSFFLMELVWYRMLGPLLGGSVFTFGLILAIALGGIGLGGLLYALSGGDKPATLAGFACSCLLEAAAIAAGFALGDRIPVLALVLLPLGHVSFGAHVWAWTLITVLVVLPPALVAGYQFPLLIALFGRGRERVGRQIGLAYATNTLGAIIGSLAGGFGLLPWLSAPGAWRLVAASLVALGLVAVALASLRGAARRVVLVPMALTATTVVLLFATGPTAVWRHSGIGAGRAQIGSITSANFLREWSRFVRSQIVWDGDGVESSVALALEPKGYAFIVNGKSDGSARGDAGTQVMLGLVGAALNPQAKRALVIGLGTGSTAGWLGAVPSMDRVDVVELEPLILDVARACREVNRNVLDNPKVQVTIGDAREFLLTTRERYDVIASEPSNPFRAGIASLFTREYYQAADDRLTPDGLFVQWVQAYEIDARTLRTVYATMASVFPQVQTWHASGGDLLLVGAKHATVIRPAALAARMAEEPFKPALAAAWRAVDLNGFLAHYLAGDELARAIARAGRVEVNTDDRNLVEFGFARSVGVAEYVVIAEVRDLARALGTDRPALADDPGLNWAAVDTAWYSYYSAEGRFFNVSLPAPREEQLRRAALMFYYRDSNFAAAREAWRAVDAPPRDPSELAMVADLSAETGSNDALALIEQLRAVQPGEADSILATLRFRQGRYDEAATAAESAFAFFRADPWALTRHKQKALDLVPLLAARDRRLAQRMYDALRLPLAIRAVQESRLTTEAELTRLVDFGGLCRGAIGALEPNVPWNEGFLAMRRDCYRLTGDPRAAAAVRDLEEFFAREPLPLATGVVRRDEPRR